MFVANKHDDIDTVLYMIAKMFGGEGSGFRIVGKPSAIVPNLAVQQALAKTLPNKLLFTELLDTLLDKISNVLTSDEYFKMSDRKNINTVDKFLKSRIKEFDDLDEILRKYPNILEISKMKPGDRPTNYVSPLLYVSERGNVMLARHLLVKYSSFINKNEQDDYGRTALMHFLSMTLPKGSIDIIIRLYDNVDITVEDNNGMNALMYASANENISPMIIQALIQYGPRSSDYINKYTANGSTALIFATIAENYNTVKKLLERGANPNFKTPDGIQGPDGKTALIISVENDNIDISKLLVKYNANVNIRQSYTLMAPLLFAISNKNIDMVEFLLESGANPNILNLTENTPYSFVLKLSEQDPNNKEKYEQIITLLQKHDADPFLHQRLAERRRTEEE